MATLLTQASFNPPYNLDTTQTRHILHGSLTFSSGTYVVGGLLPNFNYATGLLSPMKDPSGQIVELATYTTPAIANVTGITVSGTTVTVLTTTPPAVNQFVTLGGFTNSASVPLNGITAQVTAISAGVSFTCTITTTATTVTDNGQAVTVIGPDTEWIQSTSGSAWVYLYNKVNATVQIFTSGGSTGSTGPMVELTAIALPASVLSDVVEFEAEWARS